ncbi:hypothetical protein ACVJMZ_000174 [Sinorhizobium medicae]
MKFASSVMVCLLGVCFPKGKPFRAKTPRTEGAGDSPPHGGGRDCQVAWCGRWGVFSGPLADSARGGQCHSVADFPRQAYLGEFTAKSPVNTWVAVNVR